jgi:hypothetical protein
MGIIQSNLFSDAARLGRHLDASDRITSIKFWFSMSAVPALGGATTRWVGFFSRIEVIGRHCLRHDVTAVKAA